MLKSNKIINFVFSSI